MRTVISMAAPMLVRNALIYDSLRERTLRTQKFVTKQKLQTRNPKVETISNDKKKNFQTNTDRSLTNTYNEMSIP
jgi:hypothetical protein